MRSHNQEVKGCVGWAGERERERERERETWDIETTIMTSNEPEFLQFHWPGWVLVLVSSEEVSRAQLWLI